jgi:hypothetical protein
MTKTLSVKPRGLSGPRKLYRHVGSTPVTLKLTADATKMLDDDCKRTGLKRGDLVEYLVRKYGKRVPTGLLDKTA